jgi:hypothetical protein
MPRIHCGLLERNGNVGPLKLRICCKSLENLSSSPLPVSSVDYAAAVAAPTSLRASIALMAESIALRNFAAELIEYYRVRFRFGAFGDHLHPEIMGERHDRAQNHGPCPHLGLTPARYQPGETDILGKVADREEKQVTHAIETKHKKGSPGQLDSNGLNQRRR